jgi:hypothetical protein
MTYLLAQATSPTIPLQTVLWAIFASAGGVAIAMVAIIKVLATFLPAVDGFFSGKKGRGSRTVDEYWGGTGDSPPRPRAACEMTRDLLQAAAEARVAEFEQVKENQRLLQAMLKALEPVGVLAEEIKFERELKRREREDAR